MTLCLAWRLRRRVTRRRRPRGLWTLGIASLLAVGLLSGRGLAGIEPTKSQPDKTPAKAEPAKAKPAAAAPVKSETTEAGPVQSQPAKAGLPAPPRAPTATPATKPSSIDQGAPTTTKTTPTDFRFREGTRLVDELGYFRTTGDRVTFFTKEGDNRLVGLENLGLQRVAAVLGQQPEKRLWKVTGTITEYRGENYLMVDRAILENWEGYQAGLQP